MTITGRTKLCGLIGNPVEHSFSPFIHNSFSKLSGVDMVYTTFGVKESLEAAVLGAYHLDIQGMNVTVPYKQDVIPFLVDIDPLAQKIGAVNTLVRVDGGYKGYNTDIIGIKRELEDAGVTISGENFVILGAGGAARAIAFMLSSEGAGSIIICNRTIAKAELIAEDIKDYNIQTLEYDRIGELQEGYVAIQTTSVGLHPNDSDVVVSSEEFYRKAKLGVDIVYNPYETMFMKCMKKAGKEAYNGLGMLVYQAAASYELWNDCKLSADIVNETYYGLKKELGL